MCAWLLKPGQTHKPPGRLARWAEAGFARVHRAYEHTLDWALHARWLVLAIFLAVVGMNVWLSSGLTHYWNIKQPRPETEAEARMDALMARNTATTDMAERLATWQEVERIVNEETFIVWLPTLKARIPIRNKFGNLEPTVIPHRIIWNIERIYVKSPGSRA